MNAEGWMEAGSFIFNELHPLVKNTDLELSENPLSDKSEWISFSDELPDADTSVLTYNEDTDDHNVAYYDDEASTCWNNDGGEILASHWKHLTAPSQ